MTTRRRPYRWASDDLEDGFLTVQFVAAVGLSMLMLVALANLVAFQYGRGVVRAALDEGVRSGARASAGIAECEARARSVLDGLLGGAMGDGVMLRCTDDGATVAATAEVTFPGWTPMVPPWSFEVSAVSHRETYP